MSTERNDNHDDRLSAIRLSIGRFPRSTGVYLMKDAQGRVLYVGKAKNLRDRVSSYFQPSADLLQSRGPKIVELIEHVAEVSYLESPGEVDAILHEARLIKDIQPPYNSRQTDDKTFPYLEITQREDFPGVYVTRTPRPSGSKLYGPFTRVGDLRRVVQVLQRVFRFRTCNLEIDSSDDARHFFRPCILYDIKQCSGPCADRISLADYRADIKRLRQFLESKRSVVLSRLTRDMQAASAARNYELAAHLRDELSALESLSDRGSVDEHVQPELFHLSPSESLDRLGELLDASSPVRIIEGIDIAHIMGQDPVGASVCFIDGRPFKQGYRRYKIREVVGIDDYAMIREVVVRRYHRAGEHEEIFPDLILIDGGLGQLRSAESAFDGMPFGPPCLAALAKKEELFFLLGRSSPLRLSRSDPALRLLQYIRDESHRFAQHYFNILRQRRLFEGTKPDDLS